MVLNLELAKPLIRVGSSTCSYEDSKVLFGPLVRLFWLFGVFSYFTFLVISGYFSFGFAFHMYLYIYRNTHTYIYVYLYVFEFRHIFILFLLLAYNMFCWTISHSEFCQSGRDHSHFLLYLSITFSMVG